MKRSTDQSLQDSHFIIGVPSSGPLQIHHASCVLPRLDVFLGAGVEALALGIDFGRGCDVTDLVGAEDAEAEDGIRVWLRVARVDIVKATTQIRCCSLPTCFPTVSETLRRRQMADNV
jgi:hypothetical protein